MKKARERYQNLFEGEKDQRQQYGCKPHENLPENEKQRLVECRKIILKCIKN